MQHLLHIKYLFLVGLFLVFLPDSKGAAPDSLYGLPVAVKQILNPSLEEISGLAFSHRHPNLMYVHTDSGGEAAVFMMDSLGNEKGKLTLSGVKNRDWEDIAVGPGPDGKSYIYLGEIGDNRAVYDEISIVRIPEPLDPAGDAEMVAEKIILTYPDGPRDAESLLVDPRSGNFYIISKRDSLNTVYFLAADRFGEGRAVLEEVAKLPFTNSVAADISQDGNKILIKSYFKVYYWERGGHKTIVEALSGKPLELPYIPEPQGEAIGFQPDGEAYFTISEKRFNINPVLYRYPSLNY